MTIESITTDPIRNYTELSGELWLPIRGTGSRYFVSNMGRILSSVYYGHKAWAILTPARSGKSACKGTGYLQAVLYQENGNKMRPKVHRLVAQHFIPNPNNLPQVNHKNMNTLDNRAENLEWCDNTENQRHYRSNSGKLNKRAVLEIREKWSKVNDPALKESFCKTMGKKHNVTRNTIRFVLDGKTWKS